MTRCGIGEGERPALVDHAAPVRRGRRQAQPQEAERAHDDRHVAEAQAEIDDQRARRVGQDLRQQDAPGRLALGDRGGDVVAPAMSAAMARTMRNTAGALAKVTARITFSAEAPSAVMMTM